MLDGKDLFHLRNHIWRKLAAIYVTSTTSKVPLCPSEPERTNSIKYFPSLSPTLCKKKWPPQVHQEFCCSPHFLMIWWRAFPPWTSGVTASGWLSRLHKKGTNICFPPKPLCPFLQSTREFRHFATVELWLEFRLCKANVNTISGYFLKMCLFVLAAPHVSGS